MIHGDIWDKGKLKMLVTLLIAYNKCASIADMHKGMIVLNIQRWVLCIEPFASTEINKTIIS